MKFICVGCGEPFEDKKHDNRKYCSRPCSKKNNNNINWKGEGVSYTALHTWINNNLIKPTKCQECGQEKKLDAANISGEYKRDITDWEWLCRRCHMQKDGRLKNLIKRNKSKKPVHK